MRQTLTDIRFVSRKPELAGDKAPKVDAVKATYLTLESDDETNDFDVVVDLDITSPLRRVADIENAITEYSGNDEYDLVISVVPARRSPYFNMVEKKDGFYRKICESNYTARQEVPASYELNASIYVYRPAFLKSEITSTILDNRCGISVMKDYLVLDIDSEDDFRMMEFLHRHFIEQDAAIGDVYRMAQRMAGGPHHNM